MKMSEFQRKEAALALIIACFVYSYIHPIAASPISAVGVIKLRLAEKLESIGL